MDNLLTDTKSYANLANLEKALEKYNLSQFRPIVVGVPESTRVTAIFQLYKVEHCVAAICHKGFAVV